MITMPFFVPERLSERMIQSKMVRLTLFEEFELDLARMALDLVHGIDLASLVNDQYLRKVCEGTTGVEQVLDSWCAREPGEGLRKTVCRWQRPSQDPQGHAGK